MMKKNLFVTISGSGSKAKICFGLFMLFLLLGLAVLPGSVSAQISQYSEGDTIRTIANPAGTTMNLFDYTTYDSRTDPYTSVTAIVSQNNRLLWTGINDNHGLKFMENHGQASGGNYNYWWMEWTGNDGLPRSGIVRAVLGDDGYPVLVDSILPANSDSFPRNESLAYLFDENDISADPYTYKKAYNGVNHLLTVDDEGYYYFDSNWERAKLDMETNQFTVTAGQDPDPDHQTVENRPEFFPLADPPDPDAFFTGMHMKIEGFSIPQDGMVLNPSGDLKPMIFSFSGDDDVWVFIDGILVGDVGGIHREQDLEINFRNGAVTIKNHNTGREATPTTIREMIVNALGSEAAAEAAGFEFDGDTFAAGTYHDLDFFYLERGATFSNLVIRFNTVSTYDFTAHKTLSKSDEEGRSILQPDQFRFKLTGYECVTPDEEILVPYMPLRPDMRVHWETGYDSDGNPYVLCGNSADGNINFGSIDRINAGIYDRYLPNEDGERVYCKYSYEEMPPEGATLIQDTEPAQYHYDGRTISPNQDGTYTFGDTVYDLKRVYIQASMYKDDDGNNWVSKRYYADEDLTIPYADPHTEEEYENFVNYYNSYGASGWFQIEAVKSVTDADDTAEERTFTYSLRYTGDPLTADPIAKGTVTLTDDAEPSFIDFGDGIMLTLRRLEYLESEEGGRKATRVQGTELPTWTIRYTLTEDAPDGVYKDIKPNSESFDILVTAVDNGDGTLTCTTQYYIDGQTDPVDYVYDPSHPDNLPPAAFENEERANDEIRLRVVKTLQGRDLNNGDVGRWHFELQTSSNGAPLPDVTDGDLRRQDGSDVFDYIDFGPITFTPDQLTCTLTGTAPNQHYQCTAKEYYYSVTETLNSGFDEDGITNDQDNPKHFTVEVSLDEDGNVSAEIITPALEESDDEPAWSLLPFTNTYSAEGPVQLGGTKTINDTDDNTEEYRDFTFELCYYLLPEGASDRVPSAVRKTVSLLQIPDDTEDEPFAFETIQYTLGSDGVLKADGTAVPAQAYDYDEDTRTWTIHYLIREGNVSDNAIIMDKSTFPVTVTVTDNGKGVLTASADYGGGAAFENTERKDLPVEVSGRKSIPEDETLVQAGDWLFTIIPHPDTPDAPLPIPAYVNNNAGGTYTFEDIIFTPQHLGEGGADATYKYIVTESGSVPGVSNATADKTFSITLSLDDDEELTYTIDPKSIVDHLTFINHYYTGTVLGVKKNVVDEDGDPVERWPSGTTMFNFTLTAVNDLAKDLLTAHGISGETVTATATEGNPTARFTEFEFTEELFAAYTAYLAEHTDEGGYVFTVKEDAPCVPADGETTCTQDGVTYTPQTHNVLLTLTREEDVITPHVSVDGTVIKKENNIFKLTEYTNTYEPSDASLELKAIKQVEDVDGKRAVKRNFTFELYYKSDADDEDARPVYTAAVTDVIDGTEVDVIFDDITYDREMLAGLVGHDPRLATRTTVDGKLTWTIPYVLKETATTDNGMKPNTQEFDVIVTVVDDGLGNLTASYTPSQTSLTFINEERADVPFPVSGIKYIPQRALTEDDKWTFAIWAVTDEADPRPGPLPALGGTCDDEIVSPLPAGVTDIDQMRCVQNNLGIFNFGDITFTPQHLASGGAVASYKYRVAEYGTVGNVSNMTADYLEFVVTLSLDDQGNLTTECNRDLPEDLKFTNNYYADGQTVLGALKRMADNIWPTRTDPLTFDFTLTPANDPAIELLRSMLPEGTPDEDLILTAEAAEATPTARFRAFRFTLEDYQSLQPETGEGDPLYYEFTITEDIPCEDSQTTCDGVTYETEEKTVRIRLDLNEETYEVTPRVYDVNGQTETEITPSSNVYSFGPFENEYAPSPATFTPTAYKFIEDADGKDKERTITFYLRYAADPNGAVIDTASGTFRDLAEAAEAFSFNTITYDRDSQEGGAISLASLVARRLASRVTTADGKIQWTIPYVITERPATGSSQTGNDLKPNSQRIPLTVYVTDDGYGNLTVTSSPDLTAQDEEAHAAAVTALTFTNTERIPVDVPVSGRKVLNGRPLTEDDHWTFAITAVTEGAPMPEQTEPVPEDCPAGAVCVQNNEEIFDFDSITFTPDQLGPTGGARTYRYIVAEYGNVADVTCLTYPIEFTVTVSVDPSNYDLTAVSDPSGAALIERLTFTNEYYTENELVFAAEKVLSLWPSTVPEFTFNLKGDNGPAREKIAAMGYPENMKASASQNISLAAFDSFTFTIDDYNAMAAPDYQGERFYKFLITEDVPVDEADRHGVEYTEESYPVWVTLTLDEEDGTVIPHVWNSADMDEEYPKDGAVYKFAFENTYVPEDVSWEPKAIKEIFDADGNNETRHFQFKLEYAAGDEDTRLVETTGEIEVSDLSEEPVTVEFTEITYTYTAEEDLEETDPRISLPWLLEKGHATLFTNAQGQRVWRIPYVLTEVASTDKAMMPNGQSFEIVVTVRDNGEGEFVVDVTPEDTASLTFINVERSNVEIPVSGRKYLTGRTLTPDDKWTFILTAETEGAPMPDQTLPVPKDCPEGAVCVQNEYRYFDFGSIVFTPQHLGTKTDDTPNMEKVYSYRVTEKEEIPGVTNDEHAEDGKTFNVTVSVDPVTGNLKAVSDPLSIRTGLEFRNVYDADGEGEIKVRKTLEGRDWKGGDSFTFTLSARGGAKLPETCGTPCTVTVTDGNAVSFGTIPFTDAGTYTYTVKEEAGNIGGVTYDTSEHTVTFTLIDDGKGNLVSPDGSELVQTVEITNTYAPAPVRKNIPVQKDLEGRAWTSADEFVFVIEPQGSAPAPAGSPMITITSADSAHTKTFGAVTFTQPDTYIYRVTEIRNGIGGVTYADPIYKTVKFTVSDNLDGTLNVVCDPENMTAVFTNTYSSSGEGEILVTKILSGRDWKEDDEFTFTLTPQGDAPLPESCDTTCEVTVSYEDEDHTVSFGKIPFTAAGSYSYIVTEEVGAIEGITYDVDEEGEPVEHPVTITVVDDGKGNLIAGEGSEPVQTVEIRNTYGTTGEAEISVKKAVEGADWPEDENGDPVPVTFTLSADDGGPMPESGGETVTLTEAGEETFGKITYSSEDAGKTYTYTITETTGFGSGWSASDPIRVTVTVTADESGTLTVEKSYDPGDDTITNSYSAEGEGEISVKKTLSGREWKDTDVFIFTIEAQDDAPMPDGSDTITITSADAGYTGSFGTIVFTAPGEYKYTVTEFNNGIGGVTYASSQTVTIVVEDDGEGHLAAAEGSSLEPEVEIENTYAASGEGVISVQKDLEGRAWKDGDSFTFTLSTSGGEKIGEVTVTDGNKVSFDPITFTKEGTYTYTVQEVKPESALSNITYDEAIHTVTFVVDDDGNGHLVAAEGSTLTPEPLVFTNTFTPEPVEADILARKELVGRDWETGDTFTFTLTAIDDAPMPEACTDADCTVTVESDETASFPVISFAEAGTYVYSVRENAEDPIEGLTYDASDHYVIIIVEKNEDGVLEVVSDEALRTAVITNTYTVSPVCVQFAGCKAFPGAPEDLSTTPFTFTLIDGSGEEQTASTTGAGGYMFDPFIYTAPGEYRYTVREENGEVYGIEYDTNVYTITVTVTKDEESGKLTADVSVTDAEGNPVDSSHGLNFTNPYTASALAYISVTKEVDGAEWPEGASAVFTLIDDEDGTAVDTVTMNAPGEVRFAAISYDIDDVGKEFSYTVTEEPSGFGGGWSVSPLSLPVTVAVSRADDGTLKAEVSYGEGTAFTNSYSDTSIQFHGRKTLDGRRLKNGEFRFILDGSDGTHLVTLNRGSSFTFDPIYFTAPGEYEYTIREAKGGEDGMIYDDTVYTVTVTVTENEDGELEFTTSGADIDKIEFSNIYRMIFFRITDGLPKTGFSAVHPQILQEKPMDLHYKPTRMLLEIPTLSVSTEIVEVPYVDGTYPVEWLGTNAGLLGGTAKPGEGYAVLTGHNHLNDTAAGPFALLNSLSKDDRLFVRQEDGSIQMYAVYANEKIGETDFEALDRISKEYENSITLITCEDELESGGYANRRIVAARPFGL